MRLIEAEKRRSATDPEGRDNRHALRSATKNAHESAERAWSHAREAAFPIIDFLSVMRALHTGMGLPAAKRSGFAGAVEIERQRIDALDDDLGSAVALSGPAPVCPCRDAAWGVLYALNGSALGATVLLRTHAAGENRPSVYLTLMRDHARSGALGVFFRALNQQDLDRAAAAAGARSVFEAILQHGMLERSEAYDDCTV
ncbi:MAG: hypothetical protein AAFR17_03430 [Pseudomonadota bacterium]